MLCSALCRAFSLQNKELGNYLAKTWQFATHPSPFFTPFLTAPKNLTNGLADTLAKWEGERKSLESQIKVALAAGDNSIKEWLRQQAAWWDEMRGKLIGVKTGETVKFSNYWLEKAGHSGEIEVEVPMEAATLLELLHKLNAKVCLWFVPRRDGKKGWEIDRGRFKSEVGNQVYYDGPSTLGKSHSTRKRPRTSSG